MKNIKQYYKELGKLVYAVAMADGTVQPEEREKVHEVVMKELAGFENESDSSGMNKAFYVDFEFEFSQNNPPDITQTIVSFNHFVNENIERGDKPLLARSIKLLDAVANAYTRKKEKDIIEVVKENFNTIKTFEN